MYVETRAQSNMSNLRWIFRYCRPDLHFVGMSLVLFAINDTMAMIMPLLMGCVVDQVILGGKSSLLMPLCLLMIIVTIIRVGSRYIYQIFMERFGQNTIYRLVSDEYERLHALDFTYFNHTRTGDIMSRMTSDTDAIRRALSWVSYQALDCVVMFFGALSVMMVIEWRLALTLAALTPVLFFLTRALAKHARPLFLAIRESVAGMNSMVEENIEGNRIVKAFVRESFETAKFDDRNQDYYDRNMALARNTVRYMPFMDAIGFMLQLITIGLGGFFVMQGMMSLGALIAFSSFLWMLDMPVRQSGWLINDWQRFNAACVNIRKLLSAQSHLQPVAESPQSKHAQQSLCQTNNRIVKNSAKEVSMLGSIRFEHVNFAFPDDKLTPILQDIDFEIPAGSSLGILGETGSGKSTLVNLIARFYDPSSGRVYIDGIDARSWALADLRRNISVVAQDNFLFSDTIEGNITFGIGDDDYDHADIRNVARVADADKFIMAMPQGYETIVGERGVGLSGGQRQRLSLARALADNPSILIMDDTTSAVDMETEARIQRQLRELEGTRTMITIAHRISSIKNADLILVLSHGRIVERGTHAQLIAQHGRYWEIYRKQLGLQTGDSQGFGA